MTWSRINAMNDAFAVKSREIIRRRGKLRRTRWSVSQVVGASPARLAATPADAPLRVAANRVSRRYIAPNFSPPRPQPDTLGRFARCIASN